MPEQPLLRTPMRMPKEGLPRLLSSSCTRFAAASVNWMAWGRGLAMMIRYAFVRCLEGSRRRRYSAASARLFFTR
jgi:hypothetical protein